jgi:glycosyltransferase involved in cell wall biosynthesis
MHCVPQEPKVHYNYFAGIARSAVKSSQIGRHLNRDSTYPKSAVLATQKPLPISVCMISGAEAARIGRALASVAGWTSEIVVVLNQEVVDGTAEVAAKYGAKVFREPWKGHIAQKNSAADKATQQWILGLDADEVVSAPLREEIQAKFTDHAGMVRFAAYSFPRRTWYCGRWIGHGDWYPDRQIRLWRRGSATWGGIDPHDKLLVNGRIGKLRADLHHYTNDSITQHVQKIIPFAEEFVRQNLASGRSVGVFDLFVRPFWRFVRAYFLRLGFLDGWQGYYIAWLNAFSSVTRYARLLEPRPNTTDEH